MKTQKDDFEIVHCFQNREKNKHHDVVFESEGTQRIVVSKHEILILM